MARWGALAGGVLVQLVIGGVYAWSLFGRALSAPGALGLGPVEAAVPFEVAIAMIFVGSSIGGRLQDRSSPRLVALVGVVVFALGHVLASFATGPGALGWLVVGYGLVGGFGLGMAYIVPVALLQKWFPAQRAVVTGLAVGGFGFGATVTAPVAHVLIGATPDEPALAFRALGVAYLVVGVLGASLLAGPPATESGPAGAASDLTVARALRTPHWFLLAGTLAVAVTAGIALISMMASVAVEVAGLTPPAAAGAVGVLALFNGAGRVVWAALAQRVGHVPVLVAILVLEGLALAVLPHASGPLLLGLAGLVYLCYGGAFGTLPSAVGSTFGLGHAGAIYGLMLVGWSLAGVVGPLLGSSLVGASGHGLAFGVLGAVALVGALLPRALGRLGPASVVVAPARPSTGSAMDAVARQTNESEAP